MLVAQDGDVTFMGGEFQRYYYHEVPPVKQWLSLRNSPAADCLKDWERTAIDEEVAVLNAGYSSEDARIRYNTTIRWHTHHFKDCNWNPTRSNVQHATVQTLALHSVAEVSQKFAQIRVAPAGVWKLGTGVPWQPAVGGVVDREANQTVLAEMTAASSQAVRETGLSSDTPVPVFQEADAQTEHSGEVFSMALVRANMVLLQKMFENVAFC